MKFPQFTRFFSASILLGSIGALFSLNGFLWTQQTHNSYQLAVLKAPWSPTAHEQLAQQYRQEGRTRQAVDELRLAHVLGASTNADQINQWESERAQKEAALASWQMVSKRYPDYRDAWILSASLAYELGQFEQSLLYLARAEALDPYNQSLTNLKTVVEQRRQ